VRKDGSHGRGAVGGPDGAADTSSVTPCISQPQLEVIDSSQLQWPSQQHVRLTKRMVLGAGKVLYLDHRLRSATWTQFHT
jgi:hypothetical protein